MAAKSYYLDGAIINGVLRNTVGPFPIAVAAAGLFTVAPIDPSDAGTEVATAGGELYDRVPVTFGAPVNGVTANTGAVTFPTAGASWTTVVAVGIWDSATVGAGNLLYYGTLSAPKTIGIGDTVSFAISALSVTEQ